MGGNIIAVYVYRVFDAMTGNMVTEDCNLNDIRKALREYDASVCAWEPDMYVLNPASNRFESMPTINF